jgi:hypothetical protein
MQLSHQVFHARHQFFNWKLETRRGYPIRTTYFFMEKQETKLGSYLTPPV